MPVFNLTMEINIIKNKYNELLINKENNSLNNVSKTISY